jgi:2,3-bisphosphoglycerate-independent phosphoglycerate mutase
MPSRCILILLDGLGDRAHAVLGNKTPLQAARTPNLDRLAARGSNGLFHADNYGMVLPSENAHFAIFGYEQDRFPGRGYLEAVGADIAMAADEIALLAHFVSLEERHRTLFLAKERPQASAAEAAALSEAIRLQTFNGISFSYTQTKYLDGVLVLTGPASSCVSDSDCFVEGEPLLEIFPCADGLDDPLAATTAKALKSYLLWCSTTLSRHPVNQERVRRGEVPINGMVTQRPGQRREVKSFTDRWGLAAVSISSGLIYWGLGRFLGMDVHKVKDSDDPGLDLLARLQWAMQHGKEYDFFHVHTKAPDSAAHTKDPANKVKAIESLDRGLGKIIDQLLDEETVLVVTGDHSTPSGGPLVHSGEPVPLVVNGPGIRVDRVSTFDEVSCVGGALGQIRHREFMYFVLNWLDRAKLQGLMDSPEDHPFWPGKRRPFRLD